MGLVLRTRGVTELLGRAREHPDLGPYKGLELRHHSVKLQGRKVKDKCYPSVVTYRTQWGVATRGCPYRLGLGGRVLRQVVRGLSGALPQNYLELCTQVLVESRYLGEVHSRLSMYTSYIVIECSK